MGDGRVKPRVDSLVQATSDLKWAHSVTIWNKLAKMGQLAARELLHHKEFVAGASKDPFTKVKVLITDRTRKPVRIAQMSLLSKV